MARGPEHPVYSLIDNRLSAHVLRAGGPVVIGGSAGMAKYVRFRGSKKPWSLRQTTDDGTRVATMKAGSASLYIPLDRDEATSATTVSMRVHSAVNKSVTVRINDHKDREHTQEIRAGWSTIQVPLAAGSVRAGENEIAMVTARGPPISLAWLHIGNQPLDGDESPGFYDPEHQALVLPEGGGMRYFVMTPERGRIVGDLADPSCRVAVTALAQDGRSVTGQLAGQGSAVELGELAGQPIQLTLVGTGCPRSHVRAAALVVPGTAATVTRGPAPEYVILWIMDSLRADRIRIFNPEARPEVPTFERLARTSAVFVQNYVQGNESRVSHASIWSSLYPVKHDMITSKARLAGKWTTLDEVVKQAGKYVSGVGANGYMDPRWGFGRSWNSFRNHIHLKRGLVGQDVYDAALATVSKQRKPWFLYIGTIDTHVAWRPKAPWIWQYHDKGYKGRFARRFSGLDAERNLTLTDSEIRWVRAIYDSNVSYQDDLVRQLLAQLQEWGIADKTMLVFTADHGDEQWEHERVGHGGSLRDTLVHVPLLIHYPPLFPAGTIDQGTEVVDILPTIADALGRDMDPEWQGQSLIPLAQGVGTGYPRMSMASLYERAHVARMGVWKLRASGASATLHRLDVDPFEKRDISAEHVIAVRFLADPLWLLRAYNLEWNKSIFGNAANVTAAFPASFAE